MTIKVIALKQHFYDSLLRKAGEVYEVPERDLRMLLRQGEVRVFNGESNATIVTSEYNRRDMRAKR